MIEHIMLLMTGIILGILINQAKFCRVMSDFFKESQYNTFNHPKEFWDGVFYLNDYINEYYDFNIRKKGK